MSRNNAFSDKHEKLKHYAAMAARMDEKMNTLIGRGAFTILTLDQLSLDPLGKMDMNTERLPPAGAGDSPAPLPAPYSPDDKTLSADGLRTTSVMTVLSIVCDVLLPLHAMAPLAQKIKRSAVLWYISGNRPEGIQVYTATFRQVIDIRQQRYQHYYSLNSTASLPPSRGIALHLRTIFRILKLQPCDNDDDEGDD
nr:hypothetical protein [uncultured Chitinophaga sp.]